MPHKDPEAHRAYQREYQRRWARENRDKRLKYERSWHERNPGKKAEYQQTTRADSPQKTWARNTLERGCCEVCEEHDAQGHHDDYSKPLEVRWLCRTHHMELHRRAA